MGRTYLLIIIQMTVVDQHRFYTDRDRHRKNARHTFSHNDPDASDVDRHRFDADPDPDFQHRVGSAFSDRHQDDADPHADPTQNFTHVDKSTKNKFFYLL